MEEIRQQMGEVTSLNLKYIFSPYYQGPVYLSFDIDAIDPGFCPGTGTPEIGGLTSIQVTQGEIWHWP